MEELLAGLWTFVGYALMLSLSLALSPFLMALHLCGGVEMD